MRSRTNVSLAVGVVLATVAALVGGLVTATPATAAGAGTLTAGQRLVSGASLQSPAGKYRLVMQTDGNLVERRVAGNVAIWTSATAGHAGAGLIVQTDGNVVVYPRTGRAIWSTGTKGAGNALSVQDDGNLVVRSSTGRALWTSGADRPTPPPPPGDVLHAGQTWTNGHGTYDSGSKEFELLVSGGMLVLQQDPPAGPGTNVWSAGVLTGDVLTSTSLSLQRDGNLVLSVPGHVQWSSGTGGTGTANTFSIQDDGNLVVRTSAGRAVWASGSARAILAPGRVLPSGGQLRNLDHVGAPWATLTMQADGNLVLRYGAELVWSSNTHVTGSRLVMQTDGNAVVVAPSGGAVWSSGTAGHPGAVLLVGGVRDLQVTGGGAQWNRP